jgi:hypothetical protein
MRDRRRKYAFDGEVRVDPSKEAAFLADLRRLVVTPPASLEILETSAPRRIEPVAASSGASSSADW